MGQFSKPQPLTPEEKSKWNKFVSFVEANKMTGSPLLDQRNKSVGMGLLQRFNLTNPKDALPLDIVPRVQTDLQDYRNNLVKQWQSGKAQPQGVAIKSEEEIMPNLSPVDGWPGTKTLSHRFPVADATHLDNSKTSYGTDVQKFDADRATASNK